MHRTALVLLTGLVLLWAGPTAQAPAGRDETKPPTVKDHVATVKRLVAADYESLEKLYKHFHTNPELSFQEALTSARLARELRAARVEVTEKVGGYGVVGVMKNGKGPTVLVRCDMDGLPIIEKTGLPYASKVRTRDKNDLEVGV